jgi:glucose-6-phosphate isomerase
MSLKLDTAYLRGFVSDDEIKSMQDHVDAAAAKVINRTGAGSDFLGWYTLPDDYDREEFARIKAAAKRIRANTDIFIVIGIGGSYLGARAAIEFIKGANYNLIEKNTPKIYFAGNSLSSSSMNELLDLCEGKRVTLNVVSKSGTTTEPGIAFRILRRFVEEQYGGDEEKIREHIYVTTDKSRGALKTLTDERGYEGFVVPDNIGGRFSVLSAVGLLPIAVAGCDIDKMMQGAADMKAKLSESSCVFENDCYKYAALRNILYAKGKALEIFVSFDPALAMVAEWWKQLFGESEGKDGKAIFPVSVIDTTDLHSLGQIIQEGRRIMFETFVDVKNEPRDINIPIDEENLDQLNYIAEKGFTMANVNSVAARATKRAHFDGGVPGITLELEDRSEHTFGGIVFFFELACAVSGYILGVNPFDQPGVEGYKSNMFALLGKKGEKYDAIRAKFDEKA